MKWVNGIDRRAISFEFVKQQRKLHELHTLRKQSALAYMYGGSGTYAPGHTAPPTTPPDVGTQSPLLEPLQLSLPLKRLAASDLEMYLAGAYAIVMEANLIAAVFNYPGLRTSIGVRNRRNEGSRNRN